PVGRPHPGHLLPHHLRHHHRLQHPAPRPSRTLGLDVRFRLVVGIELRLVGRVLRWRLLGGRRLVRRWRRFGAMVMVRHWPLIEADGLRVREAIARAEKTTAGEIFAVVAHEADDYRLIPLLWATLVALAVPLPLLFVQIPGSWVDEASGDWRAVVSVLLPAAWIYGIQLIVFVVLAVVLSLPGIKPLIVPGSVKRARAHGLAVEQFLAHGLHVTEARTGVLLFVSLFERYAEIVADAGIASRVEQNVW